MGKRGPKTAALNEEWLAARIAVTPNGCWEWQLFLLDGYGIGSHGNRNIRAHRAAWIIYNGPIPDGLWVLHKCDNPPCCNPAHLFLGTNTDNQADSVRKGRHRHYVAPPFTHPNCKLTPADVSAIRSSSLPSSTLAAALGVDRATVANVRYRRTYKQ